MGISAHIFSSWELTWNHLCHFAFSTLPLPFRLMYLTFVQRAPKPWKELFPLGTIFSSFESWGREGMTIFQSFLHFLEVGTLWQALVSSPSIHHSYVYGVHSSVHLSPEQDSAFSENPRPATSRLCGHILSLWLRFLIGSLCGFNKIESAKHWTQGLGKQCPSSVTTASTFPWSWVEKKPKKLGFSPSSVS